MTDQQQNPQRQRQVDDVDGNAGIPLEKYPAETSDQAPTSEEVAERTRQTRDQLTDDQRLITGIRTGFGMLPVPRWTGTPASGWTLTSYSLELLDGRPFGSLFYRANDDRVLRVGVRWDDEEEQLDATALHETEPRVADNATEDELDNLERDARGRVGALLTINAAVGSFVASTEAEDLILDAAGLSRTDTGNDESGERS
jgi:hypothetical protein